MPLAGTFVREKGFDASSQDLQDFYEEYERVQQFQTSMEKYLHSGDKERAVERRRAAEGERFFQRAAAIKATAGDLKQLGKVIDAIYKAPPEQLTPEQKRERLDTAYERMVTLARFALGRPPLHASRTPVAVAK
jgi:hypothetical protein